jgi:hypothetical protein
MFTMITDHRLRVIGRLSAQAANLAHDHADETNTPSAHSMAAKTAEAADYAIMELTLNGLALPGDIETGQQFTLDALFHRARSEEAAVKLRRGF